jgi:predicted nucleotidyltransferase
VNEKVRDIAFRFAQRVSRYDPLYIVLYGSAARETDTQTSDLDFLVVFDTEELDEAVLREVGHGAASLEAEYDKRLEIVYANSAFEGLDKYYVEKVFSEGILLYARRADVTLNDAPVRAYTIVSFSLDGLTGRERAALCRRLWGKRASSKSSDNPRSGCQGRISIAPSSFPHALLTRLKALRLSDEALLVPTDKVGQVEQALTECQVSYVKLDVWLPA